MRRKCSFSLFLILFLAGALLAEDVLVKDLKSKIRGLGEKQLSKDIFYRTAPAFRLDSAHAGGSGHVGDSLYIFGDEARSLRGKTVKATFQYCHLEGSLDISVGFRVFSRKNDFLGGRSFPFQAPADRKWRSGEIIFQVPDVDDIGNINVNICFYHHGEKANVWVVDEVKVWRTEEDGFTAYPVDSIGMAHLKYNREPLVLVKDAEVRFQIVIDPSADPVAVYAAEEVQTWVRQCTGSAPEIVRGTRAAGPAIWIGDTAMSRKYGVTPKMMPLDNYVVARVGKDIVISGGDSPGITRSQIFSRSTVAMGTLFAAYEFLENVFEVRWFWPGKYGSVTPARKNLTVDRLYRTGDPAYAFRGLFYDTDPDPDISGRENMAWQRRIRLGGADSNPIGMHSFGDWSKKYGNRPELFALQSNGQRKVDGNSGTHLCLTNPEVIRLSAQVVIDYFNQYPREKFYSVMPGDCNDLYFCRCPRCQKTVSPEKGRSGIHSNAVWNYVNQVAALVARVHPDKLIKCCAYADYLRRPDFPLLPNIAVTICFGPVQTRGGLDYKQQWRKVIDEWKPTGAKLYVWEYWNEPRFYRGIYGAPAVFPRQLREIYLIDKNQVSGRVMELANIDDRGKSYSRWTNWLYDIPNLYIGAKLMWNWQLDVDDELERFYRDFYGPAEVPMRKFFDGLELAWTAAQWRVNGKEIWDHEACWKKTYPPELVKELMGYLREAVKLTENQKVYGYRTKKTLEAYLPMERWSRIFSGRKDGKQAGVLSLPLQKVQVTVDGKLDTEEWSKAVTAGDFADSYEVASLVTKTEIKLLRDEKYLYVGISAEPADQKKREVKMPGKDMAGRDALLWNAESVEVLLAGKDGEIYQFIVAPDHLLLDLHSTPADAKDGKSLSELLKWNPEVTVRTSRKGSGWQAELKIPFREIQFKNPLEKNAWLVNFARNHYYRTDPKENFRWEQSMWLPTYGSFHNYKKYGRMVFP